MGRRGAGGSGQEKLPLKSAPQSFGAPASARAWLEYTAYRVASFSDKVASAGGMKPDTQALPQCSMLLIGLRSSVSGNTRSALPREKLGTDGALSV